MRPLLVLAALGLLSLSAFACSASTDEESAGSSERVTASNTISFKADGFKVEASGKLAAGDKVVVNYDLDRLPQCRGTQGGAPGWNITGFASFNGQAPTAFEVSKVTGSDRTAVPYELKIPEGGDLAIWFSVTSRWGCNEFDSQYGQNFHFEVDGPSPEADTTLTFRADGNVDQSGPLKAGATVAVRYEQERLTKCRSSYLGYAAWSITGHARVNDGDEQKFATTKPLDAYGQKRELLDNIVKLGEAGELQLWFENNDRECVGWDSKDGKNYRFTIER